MGGTFNVAVRFPNGETRCNNQWTNSLPAWVRHPRFMASNEPHFRQIVGLESDVRDTPLAPEGYGLVVIDMVTKTVFSMNGYSNFVENPFSLFSGSIMTTRYGTTTAEESATNGIFHQLLSAGRFSIILTPKDGGEPIRIKLACTAQEWDGAIEGFREEADGGKYLVGLDLDFSPWRIVVVEENNPTGMRSALIEAGFVLTERDLTAWVEWEKERSFDEE